MKIVVMGAPGAGKGTHAELLKQRLNIPAISTGQILRDAIKARTPLGAQAKGYLDDGKLVPDDIMTGVIKDRLEHDDCAGGFILDGFPRTVSQAVLLTGMGVALDAVLSIEVSDDEIEKRIIGRRVCPSCGQSYHVDFNPPKRDGICDGCSAPLERREDDNPETVRSRLKVYHETTEPVKGYYERLGKLRLVISSGSIETVSERVFTVLGLSNDSH